MQARRQAATRTETLFVVDMLDVETVVGHRRGC